MIQFAKASYPCRSKNKIFDKLGLALAGLITFMTVVQLFQYEQFGLLMSEYEISRYFASSVVLVSIITTVEIFSLPFLLRMKVSPAFRLLSLGCGWLTAIIWFYFELVIPYYSNDIKEPIIFGGLLSFLPMTVYPILTGLIFGLTIFISYGMWPKYKFNK